MEAKPKSKVCQSMSVGSVRPSSDKKVSNRAKKCLNQLKKYRKMPFDFTSNQETHAKIKFEK